MSRSYFVLQPVRFQGLVALLVVAFADRARSTFFAMCFVGAFVAMLATSAAKRSVAFDSCDWSGATFASTRHLPVPESGRWRRRVRTLFR